MQDKYFDLLFLQIKNIILNKPIVKEEDYGDEGFRKLQEAISYLADCLSETNAFLRHLSTGNLHVVPPERHNFLAGNLKELHAGLRHLTWQAGQVAGGDYKQKVHFLGEFSDSFNAMIYQLEERENKLTAQAAELTQSMQLLVSIMDRVKEWVITVDEQTGEVIYANRTAREKYFDAEKNAFHCQTHFEQNCALIERLTLLRAGKSIEKQFHFSCPVCERILWVESNRIRWSDRYAYVFFLEDVTSEVGEREELKSLAFQDELTGLYNRRYCMKLLEQLVNQHKLLSVCVIDLNQLKLVNDTYGHLKGDEYISTIADEMNLLTADNEGVVSRVGGDEFVLLLPGFDKLRAQALLDQLVQNVERISQQKDFPMSISYGIMDVSPHTSIPLEHILREADERMYEMKEQFRKEQAGQKSTAIGRLIK